MQTGQVHKQFFNKQRKTYGPEACEGEYQESIQPVSLR